MTRISMLVALLLVGNVLALQEEPVETESYVERVRRQGAVLELSLKDAIRLALTNNLEITIEDFNEEINRERSVTTRGFFDPILNFRFGFQSSETLSTNLLTAGAAETFIVDGLVWDQSVDQNVPGGGRLNASFGNNRRKTNDDTFSTINPEFASDFSLGFTQPLWRGFLRTATDRELKLINLDSEISDSQFRQRVSEIVQQVENQYWELVFTIENQETRRQSMSLAVVQYENNRKRVEIGVLAPIEITAARAEVSTREQEMIQAEVQIVNAQNALKRLLAADPQDSIWNLTLIPTEAPKTEQIGIDLHQAIEAALSRRPELEQMKLELGKNDVDQEYYQRESKPTVNLQVSFGSTGRAGTVFDIVPVFDEDGDVIDQERVPAPDSPFFGNFIQSIDQVFRLNFTNWAVFADVQIPLRNRTANGQLAQVGLARERLLSQVKNQQQLIMVDVRNAFEGLAIQRKSLEAANVARQLSQEQLDGENKRFEAGLSTNFEVLRFQRDLAQARVQELRALVDYQLALTALEKAMDTIVNENDIVLARR